MICKFTLNLNIIYQSNLQVSSKSAFKNKKRKVAAKAARLAEAAIPAQTFLINNNKTCSSFAKHMVDSIGQILNQVSGSGEPTIRQMH